MLLMILMFAGFGTSHATAILASQRTRDALNLSILQQTMPYFVRAMSSMSHLLLAHKLPAVAA